MLQKLLKSYRKWSKIRRTPVRRPWGRRLYCEPLEDRCLLSVSLGGPSEGLVGAPATWTATANGDGPNLLYQFRVQQPGDSTPHMVQDYSTSNSLRWNPMQEGSYQIEVNVETTFGGSIVDSGSTSYTADTRITANNAVISATANPLVALYSAPPLPANNASTSMYVQFSPDVSNPTWRNTAPQPIVSGQSTNFIVGGMLPNTTYLMRDVLSDGTVSDTQTFTTGSLPTNLTFPTFTVEQPPTPGTDPTDDMVFHAGIGGGVNLLATDLAGNIDWYYDPTTNPDVYAPTLAPGGTVLMLSGAAPGQGAGSTVQEIDLMGDTLRQTNVNAVNAQLKAMGQLPIINFNHEALRLPNGYTAVLAETHKTIDVNGTPTLYTGADVVVLDQNFQVAWVWDSFQYLDTSRQGTGGEPPTDWLHANSIALSPEDGNLLVSLRAQDWVLKINYDNGLGDGHIIWRLGAGGDFTVNSSLPNPWFSHQHDARYINDNTITLFDDGNTAQSTGDGHSSGQEWVLNEQTMTATLRVNADLGNFSPALGAAQVLPNGNLDFTSGDLSTGSGSAGQSIEVSADGTPTYRLQMNGLIEYRSYFVNNLYQGTNFSYGLLDSGFENPHVGAGSQSDPANTAWTFSGTAGVAGNGSALTSGSPNAPQGSQVAFLQQNGSISQVVNVQTAGAYQLSLLAAQLGINFGGNEEIQVQVDGTTVADFTPTSTSYAAYTTPSFQLTAGSHTLTLVGVSPVGDNDAALIDQLSLTNIPGTGTAAFLATDRKTQGNWQGVYGSQGYNLMNDASSYPSYAQVLSSGASSSVWSASTTDPRALQQVNGSDRIAAYWYAPGSFTEEIHLTDGQTHQLALYLLDWDQDGGGRSEQVEIVDAATGTVLDSETASYFINGEYLVWNVSGDIEIKITNLNSASDAVLSGLFLDPAGSPPPPLSPGGSANFVKTDTTTQGNWQNVYGQDGYNVIEDAVSDPSYAQVQAIGNSPYIWGTSPSDPRDLQEVGSSNRIAASWFSSSSFTIDVNITDGQTHQVALYALDWDGYGGGRSEQIDILDATTGNVLDSETVSNFQNGEYLVWNVSGKINIRVTNLNGPANAVLSGLFFDPVTTSPPPSPPPSPPMSQPPAFTSANNTTFTVGSTGTFTVTASGIPTPTLSESSSDTLPLGVTFNPTTGVLSGTAADGSGGAYTLHFTASSSAGSVNQVFTLTVDQSPAITSGNSATFVVGQSGSFTVTATGAPTPTLSGSAVLPRGITFTDNGNGTATLGGTPASGAQGTYEFSIMAHNGVGGDFTQSFTLTVNPAGGGGGGGGGGGNGGSRGGVHQQATLDVPPLLALFNLWLGGVETVNADDTETIVDSFFGIPLLVSAFDHSGHLVSVDLFGFIDVTFLFS